MESLSRTRSDPNVATLEWNELWSRCIGGCYQATELLTEQLYPILESVCARRARNSDDVRDLVQRIMVSLLGDDKRKLRLFDPGRGVPLPVYVVVVASRSLIDFSRSKEASQAAKTIPLSDVAFVLEEPPTAERDLELRELCEAVSRLPQREQLAIRLRLNGLRSAEIGKVIGLSKGGVDKLLWKTRRELRRLLDSDTGLSN